MKVVFDSNVYVSALAIPGGAAELAVNLVLTNAHELIISKQIVEEVLGILARKFDRNGEELARTAFFLSELATVVNPRRRLRVLADEPDNRILECALTGKAEAIVTGDKAMLKLSAFEGVRIITLRKFLEHAVG